MSNTERFYPAPPAPGSAPVPAPADNPSASRQRIGLSEVGEPSSPASGVFAPHAGGGQDPWDDLSEVERSFLALSSEEPTPRLMLGAAALAEMEAAAEPVRKHPTPAPVVAARLREERLRDTAPARRDIVVVRKRAVTPDGFELAAPAGKPTAPRSARSDIWQRALPWVAVLGVVCGAAVFIQGQLQLVRRIRAAIPSPELDVRAPPSVPRPIAPPASSAATSLATTPSAEVAAEVAVEAELPTQLPPSVSPPNATDSPVIPATSVVGTAAAASPAPEAAPMADKLKPRSVGAATTNNVSLRSLPPRRPALPNKKSSWLDTPISPPED